MGDIVYIQRIKQDLSFLKYNRKDLKQISFLKDIENDKGITKYIHNIAKDIELSEFRNSHITGMLVKDNTIDEYIGVCTIKPAFYDITAAPVEYAVHEKYRFSNKKYGSHILLSISDLLFLNDNYSKIVLEIKGSNTPSIKAATNARFTVDFGLAEVFNNEGYDYVPYSLCNRNYTQGRSKTLNNWKGWKLWSTILLELKVPEWVP